MFQHKLWMSKINVDTPAPQKGKKEKKKRMDLLKKA